MPRIKKPRADAGFFLVAGWTGRPSAAERTATLAGALRTFLCFVDTQRSPVHLEAIQGLDSALRFTLRHVDEAEATRLAGLAVVDELHRLHFSVTLEQSLHVLLGCCEGEISHVNRRHPSVSLQ